MNRPLRALAVLALVPCSSFGQDTALTTRHDGRWSVVLTCEGTKDTSGLVKGYEYRFDATLAGGVLRGQYGTVGAPASATFTGKVREGGALTIEVVGKSGDSAHA